MIEIKDLEKKFNNTPVLNGVSYTFKDNMITAILGKSGSGKSTMLNLIGSLLNPTNGDILVDGESIINYDDVKKSEYRNKKIGYVFQSFYLDNNLTSLENVMIPQIILGINKKDRITNALAALEKVGLTHKKDSKISELSGGEKQRVCIARAIINNPDILLCDEPTGNLDSENGKIILELLKRLSENKCIILVTHDIESAKKYADEIVRLKDGKITYED